MIIICVSCHNQDFIRSFSAQIYEFSDYLSMQRKLYRKDLICFSLISLCVKGFQFSDKILVIFFVNFDFGTEIVFKYHE